MTRNPEGVSQLVLNSAIWQSTRACKDTLKTFVHFSKHLPKLHLTHKSLNLLLALDEKEHYVEIF